MFKANVINQIKWKFVALFTNVKRCIPSDVCKGYRSRAILENELNKGRIQNIPELIVIKSYKNGMSRDRTKIPVPSKMEFFLKIVNG